MLILQNSKRCSVGETSTLLNWFADAAIMAFPDPDELAFEKLDIHSLLLDANERGRSVSGLSCYALYWLATYCAADRDLIYQCAYFILDAARRNNVDTDDDAHEKALLHAIRLVPQVQNLIFFSHCPDALEIDFITARHKKLCVLMKKASVKKIVPLSPVAAVNECKTKSQRVAICQLMEIHYARAVVMEGIKIRPHSLLIGMSGSGKTFVTNLFARWRGLPVFATTAGQWHLRGGTGGIKPTLEKLEELLRKGPAVLLFDEIEKVRTNSGDGNAQYARFVLDEIMGVLEGACGLSDEANANLAKSTILAAGAFQALYKKKLGDISFGEEIEDMEPLTFDDLTAAGWLPDELVNRLGTVIEIRPPTAKEIEKEMATLEDVTGIARPKAFSPDGIARSMMGFRGLETYAMELARIKIRAGNVKKIGLRGE